MSEIAEIRNTIETHTSYKCYADVPESRPDVFVSVEVTGSTVDTRGLKETGSYAVQCWNTTTYNADSMSETVADALNTYLTDDHPDIARCNCGTGYNYPVDDIPRYQLNLEVVRKRG